VAARLDEIFQDCQPFLSGQVASAARRCDPHEPLQASAGIGKRLP
jgi:hypothetical protein